MKLRFCQCPITHFGSTGQRNTLIEYLCWSAEVQCFSWPLVQLTRSPIQVCLRANGQVGAFREVLAEETVRVLVRSALPGALRVAEVDLNVCSDRELLVRRHLQPAIPGQRFPQLGRQAPNLLGKSPHDGLGVFAVDLHQQRKPRLALDQRRDVRVV